METGFELESPSDDHVSSSVGELQIVESESEKNDQSEKENNQPNMMESEGMVTPTNFVRAQGIRRKKSSQKNPARDSVLSSDTRHKEYPQTPSTTVATTSTSSSSQSPVVSNKRTRSFRRRSEVVPTAQEPPTPTPARRRLKPVPENDEISVGGSDRMHVDELRTHQQSQRKSLDARVHLEIKEESDSQSSEASAFSSKESGSTYIIFAFLMSSTFVDP